MVITFTASRPGNGLRQIDPNRDFPQLVRLLKLVFADELETGGQQSFENSASSGVPSVLWRLDPFLSRLTPGFVWEEDGRIVGNVTLLKTQTPRRFIVANVGVDPAYRQRGIARALMEAAEKDAQRRGAAEVRLQVATGNQAAKDLYRSLGYEALGSMTTWRLLVSRHNLMANERLRGHDSNIRELRSSWWREAFELDLSALSADMRWPDSLAEDNYKRDLKRRVTEFFGGRQVENWSVSDSQGRLAGIAGINSEWGRAHQLFVRVRPDKKGSLELALVNKLLRRVQYLPRRKVYLLHDASDMVMNDILTEARFRPERSLDHMRLRFT